MQQPVGVILAGGQATRMGGGDKARLMLGGQSLLARVRDRLEPQVAALALNANGDADRFADTGLPVVGDSVAGFAGPLAGVLAGLDWAAGQGAVHVVSVAADTPFFPCDLVPRLMMAAGPSGLALAATPRGDGHPGLHPTFGLWPVSLRDDLRAALEAGTRKVLAWTDRHDAGVATWPDEAAFFNVNTPQDLATAEQMI
ncbi:MAG: molybdenum cofactor guanylyltransferase MobA [Pseudomonadota bacterium]